jgi:hypothetical protein
MRALPIVSALVLTVSALTACSAQQDGSPPGGSQAGATASGGSTGVAGATTSFGGSTTGTAGATTGFGGSTTGVAGSTTGFGGSTTGTAGATGSAGSTSTTMGCALTKPGTGTPTGMIDDFETHPATALIPATDGRVGGWWISVNQTTGNVTTPAIGKTGTGPLPVMGGMGGGMALHFAGTDTDKAMGWGADASVALAATGNCYDASVYTGGIKLSLMGKPGSVYVQVITAQDKAASATSGNQRVEIPITATWTDTTIPWAMLVTGWGNPIALDLKSIVALDIAPSAASAADFDIWVDNIQFVN